MARHDRIVDVRYDRRLARLHLKYESGASSEADLLGFGTVPFEFADDLERKMKRFEIASDGKSVYFPDMGVGVERRPPRCTSSSGVGPAKCSKLS
jgi:hypothetical protein